MIIKSIPNIRHLRAISAVARLQSVNRAACELFVTQPAVSQAIAGVEEWCSEKLFVRHHGGMLLTQSGSKLIERVNRAISELERGYWSAKPNSDTADHFYQITSAQFMALASISKSKDWQTSAVQLGISITSLKRTIRTLELTIGCLLLHRTSSGVLLTNAGSNLATSIGLAIRELELGTDELSIERGVRGGSLRIGSMPLARAQLIPEAVLQTLKSYPDLEIVVSDGSYEDLLVQLQTGEIDLMVGALRHQSRQDEFDEVELIELPLSVVARRGHPLSNKKTITLADTVDHHWIVSREGSPARSMFKNVFRSRQVALPEKVVEAGCQIVARSLLLNSNMLAMLSSHQVEFELQAGQLSVLGIELEETNRTIGATTRKNWRPTAPQRDFFAILKSVSLTASDSENSTVVPLRGHSRAAK